jgi:hypothetical protein
MALEDKKSACPSLLKGEGFYYKKGKGEKYGE